jgi:hypothetical protein
LTLIASGCGTHAPHQSARGLRRLPVDERLGAVQHVSIGSRSARIAAAFGEGQDTTDSGGLPLREDSNAIGGPKEESFPAPCTRRPATVSSKDPVKVTSPRNQGLTSISYTGVAFDLCDGRVYGFIVTARESHTLRGVAIGQPLRTAKRAYPLLRCGRSSGDTTDPPIPLYGYCVGQLAPHRWLWFGHDPVKSIAVASVPLGG